MDYKTYKCSVPEYIKGSLLYLIIICTVAYFFYRSVWAAIILLPGIYFFFKIYKNNLKISRQKKLLLEFSETLNSVSINIKAGYALENGFVEAYKDMRMFYGEKSLMAEEILRIRKGLELNVTLEELMTDLGERSGLEDIILFSGVLKSAKRNGGNITEVLSTSSVRVRSKICVDNEIELIIAEKKLEMRIMEIVPFFILVYLGITSQGYFDILYIGIKSRLFMTACLVVYVAAVLLSTRITNIEI